MLNNLGLFVICLALPFTVLVTLMLPVTYWHKFRNGTMLAKLVQRGVPPEHLLISLNYSRVTAILIVFAAVEVNIGLVELACWLA